jgi:hypothetical protein
LDVHCDFNTKEFTEPICLEKEVEVVLDIKIEHRHKVVENFLCLVKKETYEVIFLEIDHLVIHDLKFCKIFSDQ